MIISFKNKHTHEVWEGNFVKKLPNDMQKIARRKLRMLNNSKSLLDLKVPPSNNLEGLKGDRGGYYSIRINKQWRICFRFEGGNALDVEIVDYH